MTLNNAKEKHENCFLPDSTFQCRRSSIHLYDAERDLSIRANTLIGLAKPQVKKLVNFNNEYFKQLSNSPIGTFIRPYLNPWDALGKSTEKTQTQDGAKQTKIFIPQNKNKDSDRKTTMELRRAYSNLTTNSRIKTDKNIYQQAFKGSNTDIPEIYTDRRLNLPPLHKRSASTLSRKHLQLGSLRSQHPSFPVELLPPIQLKPVAIGSNEYKGNLSDESVKDYQKEILKIYKDETNGELNNFEKVLIMRNGSTRTNQGYNGEIKLRRNKAEFNDLIDKSKHIAKFPIDKNSFQRKKTTDDIGLLVATPNTESVKEQSNFEIRKEYGKNLEQNWFKSFIQQTKTTKGDTTDGNVDFHLEMFYSPEPNEDGSVVSDTDDTCKVDSDDESKSNEMTTFERKMNLLEMSTLFSSTDVLTGENNELERDTPSDIEIVLKKNELIQKKTKHKMRKKRRKKEKRCKAMVPRETANEDVPLPIMTDNELRAIRLNIKKKTPAPVLTGKRKFLQYANAIFVAVQFRKILANIRERNRKRRSRKLKKKPRRVTWKQPSNQYAEYERSVTPPTLKDTFMKEIGNKLLKDIDKLSIISENENVVAKNCVNEEQRRNKLQSKFALEANKASLEDVERLLTDTNRMPKKSNRIRINSAPLLSMPEGFLIEISENSKGRRHDTKKAVRRTKSVMKKNKRCTKSPNVSKRSCSSPKATSLFGRASRSSQSTSCTHKDEIAKVKSIIFHRSQVLKRRHSLDQEELKKCKEIDLSELLRDIEIPAKDIRIQIIRRKIKKQRHRKAEAINVAIPSPEESDDSVDSESSSELEIESSSDCDEYSNTYTSPFVSAGVAWNRTTKRPTWKSADVDRELSRVTRFFLEMKDCSYIRWTGINQAIISRLDELM